MTEQELVAKYIHEREFLKAWGSFVTSQICKRLSISEDLNEFLKIEPRPRLKEINSLVEKAFYRGKNYQDPYTDITDKVGVRFVVLLLQDIKKIEKVIESIDIWSASKDKDFEKEFDSNPTVFTYESVHYIVRNKEEIKLDDMVIPAKTPCEVQIRTLLQHAYSELTHNTIYKPKTTKKPAVHRIIARSMALIETTDIMFKEVNEMILSESSYENLLPELMKIYLADIKESEYQKGLNVFILDAYKDLLTDTSAQDIKQFLDSHPKIIDNVKRKYDENLIYRQPIILLIYYLIDKEKYNARRYWPLTEKELSPLFTDLGIAFNN